MSYLIRCEIICDTCFASITMKQTDKSRDASTVVRVAKDEFEKAGGTHVLRGRYRVSAHYCRECQDKPMGKPEGRR